MQSPCPTSFPQLSPHSFTIQDAGMQIAKGLKTYVDEQKPLIFQDPAADMHIAQTCHSMPQ